MTESEFSSKPRTVLVVGAGASHDYGLPTGRELVETLVKAPFVEVGREHRQRRQYLVQSSQRFSEALRNSGSNSIDEFLARRPEFRNIGERSIAAHLLPREWNAVQSSKVCTGWLKWLFNRRFCSQSRRLDWTNLSVVTFNYDRLIRLAMAKMFAASTGCSPETATDHARELPIFHVYGQLDCEYQFDEECHLEDPELLGGLVDSAASGIRLMTDARADMSEEVRRIREVMCEAQRVFFLGFGFDTNNMRSIGIDCDQESWKKQGKKGYATGRGLAKMEREEARRLFCPSKMFEFEAQDSLQVLRDYFV